MFNEMLNGCNLRESLTEATEPDAMTVLLRFECAREMPSLRLTIGYRCCGNTRDRVMRGSLNEARS